MDEKKIKLLEYLEKEYESLSGQIENITNRASITATLLAGIAFLALDSDKITVQTISLFGKLFCVETLLFVFFALSFVPLFLLLLVRKRFRGICFTELYNELYSSLNSKSSQGNLPSCSVKFYTELLLLICNKNKRKLSQLAFLYNFSLFFLCLLVLLYLFIIA